MIFIFTMHIRVVTDKDHKKQYHLTTFTEFKNDDSKKNGMSSEELKRSKRVKKISIGHASIKDIIEIKGFGIGLAKKIVSKSKDIESDMTDKDLLSIKGIGKSRLAALKEYFIIPKAKNEYDMEDNSINEDVSHGKCPFCKKVFGEHNRTQKSVYIYCPHCLKYVAETQKTEDR